MGVIHAIRRLGPTDIAAARALNRLYADVFEDAETFLGAIPSDVYLCKLLASPDNYLLVAEQDGRITGGLTAYRLQKFERERSEIYVYDLAVAECDRRRGIATALLRALQTLAAQIDASVIFIQAVPVDAPAVALYSKLGKRQVVYHFEFPP